MLTPDEIESVITEASARGPVFRDVMRWAIERALEPAIEGTHTGCLNCGVRPSFFHPEARIAVGFGCAQLLRDGAVVFDEGSREFEECMTGAEAEALAAQDPDHDWRIVIFGPLSGRTYQRHEAGKWVLIEQNEGFA